MPQDTMPCGVGWQPPPRTERKGNARFAHLLDCVDAVDALVEAASASGSMDFVPEGWAGLA